MILDLRTGKNKFWNTNDNNRVNIFKKKLSNRIFERERERERESNEDTGSTKQQQNND